MVSSQNQRCWAEVEEMSPRLEEINKKVVSKFNQKDRQIQICRMG